MNRQIKFRVWDNVDYMSSPFTLQDLQDKKVQFTSDCKIMQFTGLKDKNGKDIYENDWVVIETMNDTPRKVLFVDGGFRYVTSKHFFTYLMSDYRSDEIEVIGNIHENPEPLNN